MERVHAEIARDVALATGAPLVVLLVPAARAPPRWTAAAVAGRMAASFDDAAIARLVAIEPVRREETRSGRLEVQPCPPELAGALHRGRLLFLADARLGDAEPAAWLRFAMDRRPGPGAARALRAIVRQATARLQAEARCVELASDDSIHRRLHDAAGEAMMVVESQSGRILEANARICELAGHRRRELERLSVEDLFEHPALHGPALLGWLTAHRVVRENEASLKRRRGDPIPVALTASRIDLHGREVLHLVVRDVTRERRALAELRQAKETLAALTLAGAHLMVETDELAIYGVIVRELLRLGFHSGVLAADRSPDGTPRPPFRYVFTSFTAPLQRAVERVLGRELGAIRADPATAPLLRRLFERGRTLTTDRPRDAARQLFGGARPEQLNRLARLLGLRQVILAPLRYGQGISGVLVVASARLRRGDAEAIDAFALQASISLEKARLFAALRAHQDRLASEVDTRTRELTLAVRALKEADRRKDNFLANISHELRTPLVTVLGYTDLILTEKMGELTPRQRDALRVVSSSSRRLRSFIEELLELSRYELTKEAIAFAPVDVDGCLRQAVLSLAPRFHQRGLAVRWRTSPRTPPARADRERVLQVLTNLLLNAERHCLEGGRIRVAAARDGSGGVAVSVTDNGEGIPPEHLERIFDRLYQVGDAVRQREKGAGLGLGLAIVKGIVEAHGGTIAVRSRVGVGTTFRFRLPAADPQRPSPAPDVGIGSEPDRDELRAEAPPYRSP